MVTLAKVATAPVRTTPQPRRPAIKALLQRLYVHDQINDDTVWMIGGIEANDLDGLSEYFNLTIR